MSDVRTITAAVLACADARAALQSVRRLFPGSVIDFDAALIKLSLVEGIMSAGVEFGLEGETLPAGDPEQLDFPFDLEE